MAQTSRRRAGQRWKRVREAARRRDLRAGAVCWICGQPIDYDAPADDPNAWSPDHVVPVAKAPQLEFALSNIRASHTSCNKSRGQGEGIDRIGPTSRVW